MDLYKDAAHVHVDVDVDVHVHLSYSFYTVKKKTNREFIQFKTIFGFEKQMTY